MEFLLSLVLLLILAKLLGELSERLGFPSMLGYLVAGMVVGWSGLIPTGTSIVIFGELGAILLLFVAGMRELDTTHLLDNRKATYASAVLGFVLPALVIVLIATNAHLIDPAISISFAGVATLVACLSVSSVVTSLKVLIRAGKLNTRVGRTVLSVGVIDALFGLAAFTALSLFLPMGMVGVGDVLVRIFSIVLMLVVLFVLGENLVPLVVKYTADLEVEEAQFTLAFVVMLVLAVVVGAFGLHGVIGAFLAGIIVSRSPLREGSFSEKLSSLSYGVFVPIFFAWIGMFAFDCNLWGACGGAGLPAWGAQPWVLFTAILIAAVFLSNFLGSAIGAMFGGFSWKQSALVGLGMIPRGGVGLVILAAIATSEPALVGGFVYASVIAVVLISVLVSPFLILLSLKEETI